MEPTPTSNNPQQPTPNLLGGTTAAQTAVPLVAGATATTTVRPQVSAGQVKPMLRPLTSTPVRPITAQKGGSSMNKPLLVIGIVLALVLGAGSGYGLALTQKPQTNGLTQEPGLQREVDKGEIKAGTKVGISDEKAFKDSGEGLLEKGGIDGEGSHHLTRPGGDSQTLYITSSVIDLDQFTGRKVKVWGETFSSQKAGWFMDVGKLEVFRVNLPLLMSLIVFDHVSFAFPNNSTALDDVTFSINPGEFVFLVGPSGAGKTTLLRLLLREMIPNGGKILLEEEEISRKHGVSVDKLRRKIGTSFQDVKLLMDRTVEENIALAMEIVGKKSEEIKESVAAVLDLVGLSDKTDVFPVQLSGGEIQRIGIARAVVGDPLFIFADEPTANLDDETTWKIASLLKEINRSGKTTIVATHKMDLVEAMGERVLRLDKGKLIEDRPALTVHSKEK